MKTSTRLPIANYDDYDEQIDAIIKAALDRSDGMAAAGTAMAEAQHQTALLTLANNFFIALQRRQLPLAEFSELAVTPSRYTWECKMGFSEGEPLAGVHDVILLDRRRRI